MNKKAIGLRPFVISLVAVVLFSFFIFSFIGDYITEVNPNSELLNSKYGLNQSKNRLDTSLDQFSTVAEDVRIQLGESEPSAFDYIYLIFKGAFYIPYAFLSFGFQGVIAITNVLFPSLAGTGLGKIITVIMGVLSSVLIITLVFLIVKAIRSGESER